MKCCVDPSGIYFATLCQASASVHKIVIGEVGSGKVATEVKNLFEVSDLCFSPCGSYLFLASGQGTMAVYQVSAQMSYNIKRVVEMVKAVPSYWS